MSQIKLMYITKSLPVIEIAEKVGVDRIFIDMEYIGKATRQGGMDTVQNHHTIADIKQVRQSVKDAELVVRVNPIHDGKEGYEPSENEIEEAIKAGADIIMLPFFKTADEVVRFIKAVGGRTKTMLLFETPEAVENIDDILAVPGIDEVFIGLNDLSLGYHHSFMFKPLADGTVDRIIDKFKAKGLPYGFGGIASLGRGLLPSEKIIAEHVRLGSTCVILSRSFCNTNIIEDIEVINTIFKDGIKQIREYEDYCTRQDSKFFDKNRTDLIKIVDEICG